jgi:hypothetical protein
MASDTALTFVELVSDRRAFPDAAARDLLRLLGPTLAEPDLAARRWDVLGALMTMIHKANGKLPTVREYETIRAQEWPQAPAASTLTERYGTWLSALTSASRLMSLSRATPVRLHKNPYHPPYTPSECLAALAQFRKRFGDWPRPTEYREWSRSARRAARERGATDPDLPELKVLLTRFGTFDRALQASKAIYGDLR